MAESCDMKASRAVAATIDEYIAAQPKAVHAVLQFRRRESLDARRATAAARR